MLEKETAYPIDDLSDFKAWKLQHKNAAKLLDLILYRWRVASARIRGRPGKWAAFLAEQWCEWSKLSHDQFKRALRLLEQDRFIIRERHRFAGLNVHAFIQPTVLAITYMGKEGDLTRLGKPSSLIPAPHDAQAVAPTGTLTDHTMKPTTPIPQSNPKVCDHPSGIAPKILGSKKLSGEERKQKCSGQIPEASSDLQGLPKPLKNPPHVIWGDSHNASYPDSYPALTAIQRKQLNDFVSKCPTDYGGNILEHVIQNWSEFRLCAKKYEAAFALPLKPTVGFLLKFIASAVRQWMDDNELVYADGILHVDLSTEPNPVAAMEMTSIVKDVPVPANNKAATLKEVYEILFDTAG